MFSVRLLAGATHAAARKLFVHVRKAREKKKTTTTNFTVETACKSFSVSRCLLVVEGFSESITLRCFMKKNAI